MYLGISVALKKRAYIRTGPGPYNACISCLSVVFIVLRKIPYSGGKMVPIAQPEPPPAPLRLRLPPLDRPRGIGLAKGENKTVVEVSKLAMSLKVCL
jgi:hypothetical protein